MSMTRLTFIINFSIHINVEEKISAIANRDGGLQNLEVNGTMFLKVNDAAKAKILVRLNVGADANVQFKVSLSNVGCIFYILSK